MGLGLLFSCFVDDAAAAPTMAAHSGDDARQPLPDAA